jgi:hypothetical protein
MFQEFNINCKLNTSRVNDVKTKVGISFETTTENLLRYADVIHYTYCEEKRRTSAVVIEHLKIRGFQKSKRDKHYDYILKNRNVEDLPSLIERTRLTENQINKIVSKNKKGLKPNCRFTCEINYADFVRENIANNGCVAIPILSIESITPEYVYDFTTRSENHSFVASSFVVSNCFVESPEGQSVGVVKNISIFFIEFVVGCHVEFLSVTIFKQQVTNVIADGSRRKSSATALALCPTDSKDVLFETRDGNLKQSKWEMTHFVFYKNKKKVFLRLLSGGI